MIDILIKGSGKYLLENRNIGISPNISYGGELNQTLLAKNQPIYEPDTFLKDSPLSDTDGNVTATAVIDIKYQNISGLTVIFDIIGGVFPRQFTIYLKRQNGTTYETISQKSVSTNGAICYVGISGNGIDRIEIAATNINVPYARFKLSNIYLGRIKHFSSLNTIDCNIIEEIDPISQTIPYGICDFTIRSDESIKYSESEQKTVEVYYKGKYLGLYFIDGIKNLGNGKYQITSHDIIGELEKYQFTGDVYSETLVIDLISQIHSAAGLPDLSLSELPADSLTAKIQGHIPVSSCRDALQMVLQAAGWYADASRSFTINYKKRAMTTSQTIKSSCVAEGFNINLDNQTIRISVSSHDFLGKKDQKWDENTFDRYSSDEYGKGYKPVYVYTKSPGDYKNTIPKNAIMEGTTANRLLIDGTLSYKYQDENGNQYYSDDWYIDIPRYVDRVKIFTSGDADAATEIAIDGNTMISQSYAQARADSMLTWYLLPKVFNGKIMGNIKIGERIKAELRGNAYFEGTIIQIKYMPIGKHMISEVTMRGGTGN